jgi:hypothetical protein
MKKEETTREKFANGKRIYWSRRPTVSKFCINTDVLYEDSFSIGQLTKARKSDPIYEKLGKYYGYITIRNMYAEGRVSLIHGHLVKLEVAFDQSNRLMTSVQAFRRFIERMNGSIPLFGDTELPVPLEKDSL